MIAAGTAEPPVSAAIRAEIRARLAAIEAEEGVRVLLAVESGSRASGFHSSADSDYDMRFVYARPVDWHLSVCPGRDVVERWISEDLDISGWDLRKTPGLMLGSNAATALSAGDLAGIDALIAEEPEAARRALSDGRPEPRPSAGAAADRFHMRWTRHAEEGLA